MFILIKNYFVRYNIFVLLFPLLSQEIPNEFFEFKKHKILIDAGDDWENLSTFGPLRYKPDSLKSDSLRVNSRFGTKFSNKNKSIYGYGHFTFKNYFHGYLYPRIVTNPNSIDRFTGVPRDIKRGGFSAGETDLSGITFNKDWLTFQFGRGRQSWGAGNSLQLAISETSPSYDYGMIDLNFSSLRVRYFHGYLESDSLQNNRYINGRGLEWKNNRNLIIGLSEILIYSGENRNIDYAYLNPISTHLEIELNQRQNLKGTDSGNGIWQISIDYLNRKNSRFSFNYIFDEFVLDKSQLIGGKEKFNAYSFSIVKNLIKTNSRILSIYLSRMMVGKNTFRHEDGGNNFVQRNKPLGNLLGSDFVITNIGLNGLINQNLIINIQAGREEVGGNSILNNPYGPYTFNHNNFDKKEIKTFIRSELQFWSKKRHSLFLNNEYVFNSTTKSNFSIEIGLDIYVNIIKNL